MSKRKNIHIMQAKKITEQTVMSISISTVMQKSEISFEIPKCLQHFRDCQMEQRPVFLAILSTASCLNAHFHFVPVPSTSQREVFTV